MIMDRRLLAALTSMYKEKSSAPPLANSKTIFTHFNLYVPLFKLLCYECCIGAGKGVKVVGMVVEVCVGVVVEVWSASAAFLAEHLERQSGSCSVCGLFPYICSRCLVVVNWLVWFGIVGICSMV